ncbi:MAG TPA: DUF4191 domain-containing protein [Egibacteraceae bacterium]|nr:DUF4191 domain-containing protein [Egibacteraceae bacterium]
MARKKKEPGKPGTISQLRMAWTQSRALDSRLAPYTAAAALLGFAVPFVILLLLGRPVLGAVAGVLVAALAALSLFGRRASAVQLTAIEGQPGAAAAVVQSLRGIWRLTPAVAVTRSQDLVHRVVGRPGIVLVGEGAPARVAQLLAQEKRRVARVAKDVPVHEVSVGTGKGQVSLGDLRMHMMRLPRAVKPRQIGELERKLSALGEQNIPIPKGPMPTRPPKRMR